MEIANFKQDMEKCINHVKEDLAQIRTGRATTELVDGILVEAYGAPTPIKNIASIGVLDNKSISIQPWDKTVLDGIVKGVTDANLGLMPVKEGDRVIVRVPDLTEERRKEYVKIMKDRVEDGRISVRQIRQKYMKQIEEEKKTGLPEDEANRQKDEVEKVVKETNARIEEIRDEKEKSLMTL